MAGHGVIQLRISPIDYDVVGWSLEYCRLFHPSGVPSWDAIEHSLKGRAGRIWAVLTNVNIQGDEMVLPKSRQLAADMFGTFPSDRAFDGCGVGTLSFGPWASPPSSQVSSTP
jgi:hypothetical protein